MSDQTDKLERYSQDLLDYKRQTTSKILELNNSLDLMQGTYNEACNRSTQAENLWMHIQNTSTEKTLELGNIIS